MLIAAALALSAFAFVAGCKSTAPATNSATTNATAPGSLANDGAALAARVKQAIVADPALRSLPMSVATYP